MFDKTGVHSFFTSWYVKVLVVLLFLSISLYVSYDVRDGQVSLDGLTPLVKNNVLQQVHAGITQQVNSQYPIATDALKNQMIEKEYQQIVETGVINFGGSSVVIDDFVAMQVAQIKQNFQTPDGQTYMGSIDPYYYVDLAQNFVQYGHTGDSYDAQGNPLISKSLAPLGVIATTEPEFNIWIIAKIYQHMGINRQSSDSQKYGAIFLLPVWLSLIAVFPCYFIIRRFANDLFALFGTLVCMCLAIFVSRTMAGAPDNDPYYVIFPLIIAAFFVYAISEKKTWLAFTYAAIAGIFQGVLSVALGNAWFIFVFIFGASCMYLVYLGVEAVLNKSEKNIKTVIASIKFESIVFATYVISSVIFTYIIRGSLIFVDIYWSIFGNVKGIAAFDAANIWPNVLSSVAELNPASFANVVDNVGGKSFFFFAMLGMVLLCIDYKSVKSVGLKIGCVLFAVFWFALIVSGNAFVSLTTNSPLSFLVLLFIPVGIALLLSLYEKNTSSKLAVAILLSVWMAGTIYMSFNGVRFILLLGPAFAISFGISLFYISKGINKFCTAYLGVENVLYKHVPGIICVSILFFALFTPVYSQANAMTDSPAILFDRAWFDAMESLKANSSPDAIVTSWWDFGHFFRAQGERAVTFDGASQLTPQSHWVGRFLMENNETVARDMLKMLICGGNTAFNVMYNESKDATGGILVNKVIYQTFGKSNSEKEEILQSNDYLNFTEEQTTMIMKSLSCENPRESIVITSGDMVGKASVWAHWGSWDFTKKYVFDNYKSKSVQEIASALYEDPTLISRYVNELNKIAAVSRSQNQNYNSLINQWFAPYPGYYPGSNGYFASCTESNSTISCDNSVSVSLAQSTLSVTSGLQVPIGRAIFISSQNSKDGIKTYDLSSKLPVGTVYVDAVFVETGANTYNLMLAQSPLGGSLFTRLFFLDGLSTKYFEPIGTFNSQTQGKISMWKTNWTMN